MSQRKPLVWGSDGRPEELTSADSLDAVVTTKDSISLTNANAGSIAIGQPVYAKTTADQVDLARANASGTKNVLGLVADTTIASSAAGVIQTDGVLTATTGQWDTVTGQTGGLTIGSEYWLSGAAAGGLTSSVPGSGNYLVRVGTAVSTTEMEISIIYVGKKA